MNSDAYYTAHTALGSELWRATLEGRASASGLAAIAAEVARLPPPGELETALDYFGVHPNGWTYASATQAAEGLRERIRRLVAASTPTRTPTRTPTAPTVPQPSATTTVPPATTAPATVSGLPDASGGIAASGIATGKPLAMTAGRPLSGLTLGLILGGAALAIWLWRSK